MSRRGHRFNEQQKLAILKEGEKNGVKAVCAKYDSSTQSYAKLPSIHRLSPFSAH
jgi:hypothetical protein